MLFQKTSLILSALLFLTTLACHIQVNHAFTLQTNSKTTHNKPLTTFHPHRALLDGTDMKVNGESSASSSIPSLTEKIESIRQEAISQYEQAMEYYMFELGNDIIFLSNPNDVSNYITKNFDTIIFDCDGVLYRGGNIPIPESQKAIRYLLQEKKKQILFLTNNAEYSREELCSKLNTIFDLKQENSDDDDQGDGSSNDGFIGLTKDQMITSSYSTAKYLDSNLVHDVGSSSAISGSRGNVVVIGSNGLCNEIEKFGFQVKSLTNILNNEENGQYAMDRNALASYSFDSIETFDNSSSDDDRNIDAIVIGLDTSFTYRKLCIVSALIKRHPNALFIATNEDAFDVVDGTTTTNSVDDKRNLPGNGSIVASIEMTTQEKAINVGKPSKVLVELLQKEYQFDYERTLMVGDRLDTDIKFGKDGGMKSALVLTGCTTADKLMEVGVGTDEEPLPHIMIPHMGMMSGEES